MLILVNRFNSEERIDFICKQISNDPAYYVLNKYNRRRQIIQQYGFMDIAIAANNVVNTYANSLLSGYKLNKFNWLAGS